MSLPREEQLELVARNIGEWPDASVELWAYFYGEVFLTDKQSNDSYKKHMAHTNPPEHFFTREEVEAKRRKITGEPDDKDAPDWSESKAQDSDGKWHWYRPLKPSHDSLEWFAGEYEFAGKGEVIGNWRDTLKKVNRDKKEASEVENIEFKNDGTKYRIKGRSTPMFYVGGSPFDRDLGVFHGSESYFECAYSQVEQDPSERDEFAVNFRKLIIDSFHNSGLIVPANCLPDDDAEYYGKAVFDAISKGKLKAPEVKSD